MWGAGADADGGAAESIQRGAETRIWEHFQRSVDWSVAGQCGLGIVVLRKRAGAAQRTGGVGWPSVSETAKAALLLLENGALLVAGLAIGMVAAGIAVRQHCCRPAQLPVTSLSRSRSPRYC